MFPLKTTVISRHVPVVTWAIIALNFLVFFFELHLTPSALEQVTYLFGMVPARYLFFYLLCGIAAGAVHMTVNATATVPAIGASGAIAGVMGAYLLMFPTSRVVVMIPIFIFPFIFDFLAVFYLGYWFLLQLLSGSLALTKMTAGGGIAFWAHVGGFLCGAFVYRLFLRPRAERRAPQPDEGDIHHAWASYR